MKRHFFQIPLSLKGVFSYFSIKKPARAKYEACPLSNRIDLTDADVEWDTKMKFFEEQEAEMVGSDSNLVNIPERWTPQQMMTVLHTIPQSDEPEHCFGDALKM